MVISKIIEELLSITLTEFDAETRFRVVAEVGNLQTGIETLGSSIYVAKQVLINSSTLATGKNGIFN